jgi:hypothetical protein
MRAHVLVLVAAFGCSAPQQRAKVSPSPVATPSGPPWKPDIPLTPEGVERKYGIASNDWSNRERVSVKDAIRLLDYKRPRVRLVFASDPKARLDEPVTRWRLLRAVDLNTSKEIGLTEAAIRLRDLE